MQLIIISKIGIKKSWDFVTKYFRYFILGAIIYFPIFSHLTTLPMRLWDESRNATNAYEMYKNHDYMVTYYEGKPDLWNTKPPFLIWSQVFFLKTLGVNVLSIRLPSAIAALMTCIALLIFSIRYLKQFWFGFIGIVVLVTSQGYIDIHVTRTGDYDSMLTLFTSISGLLFFCYIESDKKKYLYLFFLISILAVLTKGIAGLLFTPALLIYCIVQNRILSLLKNKHFYFGLVSFIIVIGGYYLIRELRNPGFLKIVYQNELGGRFLDKINEHQYKFSLYFNNLIDFQLSAWYLFIPFGLILGLVSRNQRIRKFTLFSGLMAVVFFFLISISKTKLDWYDAPLFPFFSILIAGFIYVIFDFLRSSEWLNKMLVFNLAPFIFLFMLSLQPYQKILEKTFSPKEYPWDVDFYEMGYYLKDAVKGIHNLDDVKILCVDFDANLKFYINILNEQGIRVSFKNMMNLLKDEKVIAFQNKTKEYIVQNYEYKILNENGNVITYQIVGKKQASAQN
jgi:4-amino-4-deoxy-L-arabinose transferase-like glycosyltransferase